MNKQKQKKQHLSEALKANLIRRKAARKSTDLPQKELGSKNTNNNDNESNNY